MRFLVDENLSPLVASMLREAGHDAVHVLDHGLGGHTDAEVSARAVDEGRVIISADSDFTRMLAHHGGEAPSLVLFRSFDQLAPLAQGELLLSSLPSLEGALLEGAVASLSPERVRVRRLPLR